MAGNSWQGSTLGEYSIGTFHPHVETLLTSGLPSGLTQVVTLSSTQAPTGSLGVQLLMWVWAVAANQSLAAKTTGGTQYIVVNATASGDMDNICGPCVLGTTGAFSIVSSSSTLSRRVDMTGWYM